VKFRKRVKLFPGVTLNFSKTGISTTIGVPGASVNFNKKGTFLNTGIPGTGLYDRKRIGGRQKPRLSNPKFQQYETPPPNLISDLGTELKSTENVEETTTEGLQELRDTLLACYEEKAELAKESIKARSALRTSQVILVLSYVLLIGFIVKWFKKNRDEKKDYVADLEKLRADCYVNIDINTGEEIERYFLQLLESYKVLITCEKIWDITSASKIDRIAARSAVSESITRKQVDFGLGNLDIIRSRFDALHFEHYNGGDLYIYPAFMVIVDNSGKFGLIDIREVECNFIAQKFVEEEGVPSDSRVIDYTWAKVNKDGSPDRRFKDNYQLPVCLYGNIELRSSTGLNESYSFSNYDKAEQFSMAFKTYQRAIGN
jgi:hypothetical protein